MHNDCSLLPTMPAPTANRSVCKSGAPSVMKENLHPLLVLIRLAAAPPQSVSQTLHASARGGAADAARHEAEGRRRHVHARLRPVMTTGGARHAMMWRWWLFAAGGAHARNHPAGSAPLATPFTHFSAARPPRAAPPPCPAPYRNATELPSSTNLNSMRSWSCLPGQGAQRRQGALGVLRCIGRCAPATGLGGNN